MSTAKSKFSKEESSRRGQEIFDREIADKVRDEDPHKFVSIDVETGDFEVDADMLQAILRLRSRHPDAHVWTRKVGSKYAISFGGRLITEEQ